MSDAYAEAIDKLVKYGEKAMDHLTDREKVTIMVISGVPYKTEGNELGSIKILVENAGVVVHPAPERVLGYKYVVYWDKEG